MDAKAKRVLEMFREKVGAYLSKYSGGDHFASINLHEEIIVPLEKEYNNVSLILMDLLDDMQAYDMHHWIMMAMRGMAQRGTLTREGAETVLKHTERLALYDYEEWYKSISALESSLPDVLLNFAENRLLAKQDIPGWRWLAFQIAGDVTIRHKALISADLKNKLKHEMEQETDNHKKHMFRELLAVL